MSMSDVKANKIQIASNRASVANVRNESRESTKIRKAKRALTQSLYLSVSYQ